MCGAVYPKLLIGEWDGFCLFLPIKQREWQTSYFVNTKIQIRSALEFAKEEIYKDIQLLLR